MKVLISGSRTWTDPEPIATVLSALHEAYPHKLFVVAGDAKGVDQLAHEECEKLGIDHAKFYANWKGRGKAAGPVRNNAMLHFIQPELVYAFHPFIQNSKGTKHMLSRADLLDIPTILVTGRADAVTPVLA
jgi:hypothetical protein